MSPRAEGVRAGYAEMPTAIHTWVTDVLGSPVVSTQEMTGGMSPGCATRLRCADGRRVFVKAVGTPLNPVTPSMFRREIAALNLLGSHPLWAGLLASYDDGDWVGLLLEDVEGANPDLADDDTMGVLLDATEDLGALLRERVPSPDVEALGLLDFRDVVTNWAASFDEVSRLEEVPVPRWVRDDLDGWQARVAGLAAHDCPRLQHWDIREDNLVQRPDGSLVFVDWGQALVGPAWIDPLLARLERAEDPWFDTSLGSSPALVAAGDDTLNAWLVGFATMLAVRTVTAVDIGLPTLAAFRRSESARMFSAAARRLDLGPRAARA
ncbi:phosphotransferase [Nocardioides sp.]|uniref:phosphotransferase n=1 Tax=Nocardioides sp. TaxID=35761 RepID=UPI002B84F653|nr:hypothetical protein [Nocardioides sp.]HXH78316.1 hypothetical protein [Nocardioides sp.]